MRIEVPEFLGDRDFVKRSCAIIGLITLPAVTSRFL